MANETLEITLEKEMAEGRHLLNEEEYYALWDDGYRELIEGKLYDMAPPSRMHQRLLTLLLQRIANYIEDKGGPCEVYPAPFGVKLFPDDDNTIVEPDISVICDPGKLTDRGCSGAPDWVIEIVSPANPRHDYLEKLNLYKRAGVREYWIVNPMQRNVIVYRLEDEHFGLAPYTFQDKISPSIYEDFLIDFSSFRID